MRDQALTTQLSRVLHTQHKMRNFLNSIAKRGNADSGATSSPLPSCAQLAACTEVKAAAPEEAAPRFDAARDLLVQEMSLQTIPQPCARLWLACVLCRQHVHSARIHFIHNATMSRPWMPICPQCHVAVLAQASA